MRSCYFKTPRPGGTKIQGPAAGRFVFWQKLLGTWWWLKAHGLYFLTLFWNLKSPSRQAAWVQLVTSRYRSESYCWHLCIISHLESPLIWWPSCFRHFCGFQNWFKFEEKRRTPKIKQFLGRFLTKPDQNLGLIMVITCNATLVPSLKLDWWYGKWVKMSSKIDHPHNHWLSLCFSWFNLAL